MSARDRGANLQPVIVYRRILNGNVAATSSSAAFSIVIAVARWPFGREPIGTMLLGSTAFGRSFVAGYMIVGKREDDL